MIGMSPSVPRFEELRRLLPALVLSIAAHVIVLQAFPYSVRPHAASPRNSVLTVILERPASNASPDLRQRSLSADTPFAHRDKDVPARTVGVGLSAAASSASEPRGLPAHTAIDQTGQAVSLSAENGSASSPEPISSSFESSAAAPVLVELQSESIPQHQAALPLLDYYYTSKEVDEPARAIGDGLLEYPREALRQHIPGTVKLRLFIDEFGTLVRSEVVSAHPPDIFDVAAREAVHTMSFLPARKSGQPVRSQRTVEVTFDPDPEALRDLGSTRGR